VSVALSPDGASIGATLVESPDAAAASREARVLAAIEHVRKRRAAIFKKLLDHGGSFEIRDMGLLESAVAQPSMTFGG